MGPIQDGFRGGAGRDGEGYAVVETAAGTGNRLLLFRSKSRALARSRFETELRPPQDQPPFG